MFLQYYSKVLSITHVSQIGIVLTVAVSSHGVLEVTFLHTNTCSVFLQYWSMAMLTSWSKLHQSWISCCFNVSSCGCLSNNEHIPTWSPMSDGQLGWVLGCSGGHKSSRMKSGVSLHNSLTVYRVQCADVRSCWILTNRCRCI